MDVRDVPITMMLDRSHRVVMMMVPANTIVASILDDMDLSLMAA